MFGPLSSLDFLTAFINSYWHKLLLPFLHDAFSLPVQYFLRTG
jgi:hypothetical protein